MRVVVPFAFVGFRHGRRALLGGFEMLGFGLEEWRGEEWGCGLLGEIGERL